MFLMRLALLLLALGAAGQLSATGIDPVRNWTIQALRAELKPGGDMNRVSSLTTPVSTDVQQSGNEKARAVLDEVAAYLRGMSAEKLPCGPLADYYLTAGFLAKAGIVIDTGRASELLAGCNLDGKVFDLANALLFACRYAGWDHREKLPGGLERLQRTQRQDGAFLMENGRPWFYLTSHALIAVYYCGGDPQVVARGQQRLLKLLPQFRQRGFIDGLIESLIFLEWMGRAIPDKAHHVDYLHARIHPDGGICFLDQPGCEANWHAVSLLYEWLLMQQKP